MNSEEVLRLRRFYAIIHLKVGDEMNSQIISKSFLVDFDAIIELCAGFDLSFLEGGSLFIIASLQTL